jgi:hypothetical protein
MAEKDKIDPKKLKPTPTKVIREGNGGKLPLVKEK